jgi:hypothetical protein
MTVSPRPGDSDGYLLNSNITTLNTQINSTGSTLHKESMKQKLDQLQRELVYHYLDNGRLSAASILSTMS